MNILQVRAKSLEARPNQREVQGKRRGTYSLENLVAGTALM